VGVADDFHFVSMHQETKDFMKLVLIAFAIGLPTGYYFMHQWLEGFAYKTTIDVSVFIIAMIITGAIAWFTVSFESIRTASSNP
jgi:putative ABC transport system permease protein